jgi:hypothetical protein
MSADDPKPTRPPAGLPAFLRDLERALGIGILVREIDVGETVTIEALVLLGQHAEEIAGRGATEAEAWRDLARSAMAWRTTNDKHVPWWGGGG